MAYKIKQVLNSDELKETCVDLEITALKLSLHLHELDGLTDGADYWYDELYSLDCELEANGLIEISEDGNSPDVSEATND